MATAASAGLRTGNGSSSNSSNSSSNGSGIKKPRASSSSATATATATSLISKEIIKPQVDVVVPARPSSSSSAIVQQAMDTSIFALQSSQYQSLLHQLEDREREIDRLQVALEALTPVPGFDFDKIRRLAFNKATMEDEMDCRDTKIVTLAKKVRQLTHQVNKDTSEMNSLRQTIREQAQAMEALQRELEMVRAAAASASTSASASAAGSMDVAGRTAGRSISSARSRAVSASAAETRDDLSKELLAANKTIEDLRHKLAASGSEIKTLKTTLARELGDGVSLEQAVDGNWRGRAQQIVMLKAKIKRLEARASQDDVDTKAANTLADMDQARKQAVESLSEDYGRVTQELESLKLKYSASKSRIKTLESDLQRLRNQIQVVIDKTEADDELIEALQQEIHRLSDELVSGREQDVKAATLELTRQRQAFDTTAATQSLNAEIARLERICKIQTEQLSTQDNVIRELRRKLPQY